MASKKTESASAQEPSESLSIKAGKNGRAIAIFLFITIVAALGDLGSKHLVFKQMLSYPAIETRVVDLLDDPNVNVQQSEKFSRAVLQELRIRKRICFGLSLTISTNPGVVFGFDAIPSWIVNVMTAVMILIVIVFFATSERRATWLHVALALILGGAIGNLYDRLFSEVALPHLMPIRHHVRDFIDCSDLYYNYIYNLADAWLVIGVAMIMIHWFWTERKRLKEQKARQ